MNVDQARRLAASLHLAADLAEREGRHELKESDLDVFVAADDEARAELAKAIEDATK